MDDEEIEIDIRIEAQKHTKWSFVVLVADLATQIVKDVADTMDTATTLLLQHRQHKIEEDKFYEIVEE